MKPKLFFAVNTLLILLSVNSYIYSEEAKIITVQEAVRIALENNTDYKIAELKLKESDQKVNAVWGELFPVLESEASLTRQDATDL